MTDNNISLESLMNNSFDLPKTYTQRIIDWNKERNALEFNISLEIKMLHEECREFYMANSVVERLQEFSDFLFVWTGTTAKYGAMQLDDVHTFKQFNEMMAELRTWVDEQVNQMSSILNKELQSMELDEQQFSEVVNGAMEAVIEANENKGTEKDDNGKVKKGSNYVHPKEKIESILKKMEGGIVQ